MVLVVVVVVVVVVVSLVAVVIGTGSFVIAGLIGACVVCLVGKRDDSIE